MSIRPYVPDIEAWRAHFRNRDNFKEDKDFYEVKPLSKSKESSAKSSKVEVKMVTPMAQVVEQAKAQLTEEKKKKRKRNPKPWIPKKKNL